jgi:hypothetical protein
MQSNHMIVLLQNYACLVINVSQMEPFDASFHISKYAHNVVKILKHVL